VLDGFVLFDLMRLRMHRMYGNCGQYARRYREQQSEGKSDSHESRLAYFFDLPTLTVFAKSGG
jgi:hypothetical protein